MQFFDIRTSKNCPLRACFVHFHSQTCFSPQRRAIFRHRNFKKCSESVSFFLHFDLEMRFSPQRRAIFEIEPSKKCSEPDLFCAFSLQIVLLATAACNFFDIRTSKKCSEPDLFCTCSLRHVLFATAACNFTSELQEVLRTRRVLYIFTSKCAFRHNGVQFLISDHMTPHPPL